MGIESRPVTHLTGLTVNVRGRIIQRCAICGEKLLDSQGEAIEGGGRERYPTWEENRLVRITSGNPTSSCLLDMSEILPDDLCIDLVES